MTDKPGTRFLAIRLSADEFKAVYHHLQQSTCRSLTEYVKKILTRKPVTIRTRDQSRDEVLQQLITIRNRLDRLMEGFKEPAAQNPRNSGSICAIGFNRTADVSLPDGPPLRRNSIFLTTKAFKSLA